MTSFDLENVGPKSRNFHQKEFLCGPTHSPSLVFLDLPGAEVAGDIICPLPGRVILRPFAGRVLTRARGGGIRLPTDLLL